MAHVAEGLIYSIPRLRRRIGHARNIVLMAMLIAINCIFSAPVLAVTGFADNSDGTVTDRSSGLTWKRCAEGQSWTGSTCSGMSNSYTWSQATALTATFAGNSDWRLPSSTDLQTIVDLSSTNPTLSAAAFPNAPSYAFWSATADSDNSSNALYVNFIYGNLSTLDKSNALFARMVRGTASSTGSSNSGSGSVVVGTGNRSIAPSLTLGWNLLGNSIGTTITASSFFSDTNVINSVWKWDTVANNWQFYTPSLTTAALQTYAKSKGYGVLSTVNPGEGYWVNAKTTSALATLSGAPVSIVANNLSAGWNLVATDDDINPQELNRRLSATPPSPGTTSVNFSTLWAWNNATSNWYFYAPSLDLNGILADYIGSKGYLDFAKAGKTLGNGIGFWINISADTIPIAPSLILTLSNSSGVTLTSISGANPATVTAIVKDASGATVPGVVVSFDTESTIGTIVPNTALTDGSGVATVTLSPKVPAGAGVITATTKVGTTTVTGTKGYSVSGVLPSISVSLYDAAGVSVTNISSATPATVKATVKDAAGNVVSGTVVTFSTDSAMGTITPASATALTDTSGVAMVTLGASSLTASGASTITATGQVGANAVKGTIGYSVGAAVVTISVPAFSVSPISAFGTTTVTVTVSSNGVPITAAQNVNFTSSCASSGNAVLTNSVVTVKGIATATYRDNGCGTDDLVTASVSGIASASAVLTVTPPAAGSIQFVSASPNVLSLKGIGGIEASLVRFKVLDGGGKPLAKQNVSFSLTTAVGGISLTPQTSATTDADGLVSVNVNSGTVSTPVRVTASISGTTLISQSSALTISTGIPDQDSFSLSASKLNPEFWNVDGNTTIITARLADHFNNPVPDGTVVNFTTEGGSIVASCSTLIDSNGNSNCSTTLTSQAPRPTDGRVTVLAYAVGEESFIDLNGNGVADLAPANELIDITSGSSVSTDLPEAFRDDNENGVRDASEPFFDFNQNGVYDGPDGKYSGVLCDSAKSSSGTCSGSKGIHVRKSIVIVFSGSTPYISKISPAGTIDLVGNCGGVTKQVDLRIVDINGNPLPVGTTINVSTTDGTISGTSSFVQANTNVTPTAGAANYTVYVRDDGIKETQTNPSTGAVVGTTCKDSTLSGVLTVTVTTPGGETKIAQYPVSN